MTVEVSVNGGSFEKRTIRPGKELTIPVPKSVAKVVSGGGNSFKFPNIKFPDIKLPPPTEGVRVRYGPTGWPPKVVSLSPGARRSIVPKTVVVPELLQEQSPPVKFPKPIFR